MKQRFVLFLDLNLKKKKSNINVKRFDRQIERRLKRIDKRSIEFDRIRLETY